jgi:hypothetical protein
MHGTADLISSYEGLLHGISNEREELTARWNQVEVAFRLTRGDNQPAVGHAYGPAVDKFARFNAAAEALKGAPLTSVGFAVFAVARSIWTGSAVSTEAQAQSDANAITVAAGIENAGTAIAFGVAGRRAQKNQQGEPTPAAAPSQLPSPDPKLLSPKEPTIFVDNYWAQQFKKMTDVAAPKVKSQYAISAASPSLDKAAGGTLIEGEVAGMNQGSVSGNFWEHISHPEQSAGHGQIGDFRLKQPFQDAWGSEHIDVCTPGRAMSKMRGGFFRTFVTYEW